MSPLPRLVGPHGDPKSLVQTSETTRSQTFKADSSQSLKQTRSESAAKPKTGSAITHSDLALDPQILPSDILDRTAIPIPRLDKETGEVVRAVPDVHVTEAADDNGFQLESQQGRLTTSFSLAGMRSD